MTDIKSNDIAELEKLALEAAERLVAARGNWTMPEGFWAEKDGLICARAYIALIAAITADRAAQAAKVAELEAALERMQRMHKEVFDACIHHQDRVEGLLAERNAAEAKVAEAVAAERAALARASAAESRIERIVKENAAQADMLAATTEQRDEALSKAAGWQSFKNMCAERGFVAPVPGGIVRWAEDLIDAALRQEGKP